jgi:hypothetical protein
LLTGGCLTHRLWSPNTLDNWNEPATPANLRVFDAASRKDFLVVYDEHSERRDTQRTRAYFLNQNAAQLADRRAPHFVNPGLSAHFIPVPLYHESPPAGSHAPARPFVVVNNKNADNFTLFLTDDDTEACRLPMYPDGVANYERVALTPLTVTGDLTIIGGVLGCCWLYWDAPGLGH